MEIPVIDFKKIEGESRKETLSLLHQACEKWGFFMIENHSIDVELMVKVKALVNQHYEQNMKGRFYNSDVVKSLVDKEITRNVDWESAFFIWHRPVSNINQFANLPMDFQKTMDEYIDQLIKLAETFSELMSENLGLEKSFIKQAFSGSKGPSVGTKVAKYPRCPRPEQVRGLREHTDAGGIILLLQDDEVPGLEFFKDGEWVEIPPSKNNRIFVNTGDQLEVLSNGIYKSALHRVMTDKNGSRLSIATFYNPAGDAIISPASKLLYPGGFSFQEYLKIYAETKFADKAPRLESMKKLTNGPRDLLM
ncbi:1-aminocyclopropane-1-carboxylate oxidase 1 [Coffea eugenioides]|uniref:aminocyclopropanecarboxylate oxidase n=1 Tax=Coffea arabica TaxID=13443 RepID=A0A6P6SVX5_COFAR|nr:1-aminocyclopropane-1-carboxylate oxidase 1-like [Coffea arabica]XP_027070213.1 1-aminocyclopropane-1-carboxylate oxidase 1-like [Coffea arabica]XP_027070214.1 1-aminocyclopropane-1-carboxylate oxidase 1-like [Coffea arabica]XP_027175894.1 1-aminocyclopropane-1-carboxylate oxidase 1 [Coffea eugenioides]